MSQNIDPSAKKSAKEIFLEALDLPPDQRQAFAAQQCGDDVQLLSEVEALLEADRKAGAFLGGPTLEHTPVTAPFSELPAPERQIGPYKLLQIIGEGGFGTVYMAEQEQPVRRRVALKIIKLGMDTRQVVARFEAERQALAMMDHPNIAKVFDAGATANGRPYFVMELVRGEPITQYCDSNRLTPRERLDLFVPVCQAVQHAHQKGIIHRDIKPSNVLVTLHDGKPVPKVIDFGIAKATQARLTEKTVFTEFRQMIGTPEYMSPEQAEMSGLDIDTRSDIYSLGVLLYELLTGTTPFDALELRSKAYAEIQRVIREIDPPRPSTRLSSMRETLPSVAAQRNTEPRRLNTLVRGELDWIVMKCLEKDRTRRYDTAASLAADVQRYLTNEPVSAGSPSPTYRMRKFVRRHKVGVGSGVAIALALLIGLAVATWALVQATHERDAAVVARNDAETARKMEAQARTLAQIDRDAAIAARNDAEAARKAEAEAREYERQTDKFLMEMFTSIDPAEARGKPVLVRDILDKASERIDQQPPSHKIVEGSLRFTFGTAYHSLGLADEARRQFERAAELYRAALGENHSSTGKVLNSLGTVYLDLGRLDEAEQAIQSSVKTHQVVFGPEDGNTIAAENALLQLLLHRQKYDDAEQLATDLLPRVKRVAGPESADTITVLSTAADLHNRKGRYLQAEQLLREGVAAARKLGDDHPYTVAMLTNLGDTLRTSGKFDDAIPMLREAWETGQRVLGADHPHTLTIGNNLALVLQTVGQHEESERIFQIVIERRRRVLGEDHRGTLLARGNYGLLLQAMGRFDEAEAIFRDVADRMQRGMGADSHEALVARNNIAWLSVQRNRLDEAEQIYRDLLPRAHKTLGEDNPLAQSFAMRLGHVLMMQQRWSDAEPLLAQAYAGAQRLGIANAQAGYASAYGVCLAQLGKYEQAIPLLLIADEALSRHPLPDATAQLRVIDAAIQSYEKMGQPEQAELWKEKRARLPRPSPSTQPGG